ncbi:MAG: hypothetical protein M1818_008064 [Claussenomyces sp. TS43310]|nr:MAG: hypothetical protein M1818_008064 [Claussenomyces sp. TS43310]
MPAISEPHYRAIATGKRARQLAAIPQSWLLPASSLPPASVLDVRSFPRDCGLLTSRELDITEKHDATSLALAIRERVFTSVAVVTAFCKRAALAQQLTHCLTEIFFSEALARARWLDEELERTGKTVGPLHGVPVSVKDSFQIVGHDSSIGLAALANQPATENSPLIDMLVKAGAVLYCKTNVPQTLMALDSQNWLFGRTLNPVNWACTAGGSSGGEGALIAMRGSVLGVGTDVGGSIRIPAMCNGLYGIKPSVGRVPYAGQVSGTRPGMEGVGIKACAGPIATSVRDCELFLRTVADARPWEVDTGAVFGEWDANGQGDLTNRMKPLIGVVRSDGLIEPLPPVAKAIEETVRALRKEDVEVVEMDVPQFKKCQSLANKLLGIDGNNTVLDIVERTGEPLIPWLSTRVRRKELMGLDTLLTLNQRKTEIEMEMLKIWKDPNSGRTIDAFICPVAPHPVPPMDRWNGVSYTLSFNLLDYPTGVIPVRSLKEEDLVGEIGTTWDNGWDESNRKLCKFEI